MKIFGVSAGDFCFLVKIFVFVFVFLIWWCIINKYEWSFDLLLHILRVEK